MTAMPVPLPRMCSVLAHEIRTPLSVLQGYIRLLQRQREPGHPEHAMLEAMLSATGQITAIARQASELGSWLTALETSPLPLVRYADVFAALAQRSADRSGLQVIRPPDAAADRTLRADPARLAEAIVVLAEAEARELGSDVIEISMIERTGEAGVIRMRPLPPVGAPAVSPSRPGAQRALSFERGGAGLALVAASHVFAVHDAVLTSHDEPVEFLIQFPPGGGAQ
jgi:hypothetical protein